MNRHGQFPSRGDIKAYQCNICSEWVKEETMYDHCRELHQDSFPGLRQQGPVHEDTPENALEAEPQQEANSEEMKDDAPMESDATTEHDS